MQEFVPGQRWINDAELQLGLGTVLTVEHRTVQIVFLASGETRVYAKNNAPLTRVKFTVGDEIALENGDTLRVSDVTELAGLLTYLGVTAQGESMQLEEGMLDNMLQLNRPQERLFTGQVDANKWFQLRYQCWHALHSIGRSQMRGLIGGRTDLIPHQLYIAHEVARRFAPRVLLADEVGLGKTIEAGMIIHQQLCLEQARRVLIIVPETLLHQWLVEMLRKFNLQFSIIDAERLSTAGSQNDTYEDESGPGEGAEIEQAEATHEAAEGDNSINAFEEVQLALCSLEFLCTHEEALPQAEAAGWDLLVVDEAHHLQWSEQSPSAEYNIIARLAQQITGVLLLTATPEQLGKSSHFARLRLLDPNRFSSFERFQQEEESYQPIAAAIEALLEENFQHPAVRSLPDILTQAEDAELLKTAEHTAAARETLVQRLLDYHGTGRVMFRNTRASIEGFPERQMLSYPLALPAQFEEFKHLPCPEVAWRARHNNSDDWTRNDPRIAWLLERIKVYRNEKLLLIAHSAETAMDIAEALRVQAGIQAAVFHQGMSIIERDRAAAFFADIEYGCQLLICSEIGSEGRNFQFAHHLVLFDLPENPDLLEQRIGRLDRIGQRQTIQIHVPYFTDTAQQVLMHWYHQGLNAFEHICPAAHTVYGEVRELLTETMTGHGEETVLIEQSKQRRLALNEQLNEGRDRLLEYNSCRPGPARDLLNTARKFDEESGLDEFMELVFDCFGVHSEPHSEHTILARPAEHMFAPFPHLPDEGMSICFDRNKALSQEDLQFLSWDHDMVVGAMDMVLGSEQGNCSAISIKTAGLKPGTLLLETLFVLDLPVQLNRFLPPGLVRILLDENGKQLHAAVSYELLQSAAAPIDRKTAVRVVHARQQQIEELISHSKQYAEQQAENLRIAARELAEQRLGVEIQRLRSLSTVNPNVRDEEIEFFHERLAAAQSALSQSKLRLDALRIVVAT